MARNAIGVFPQPWGALRWPGAARPGWAYTASGRAAVYRVCRMLPAGSRLWMPAFHCGVEVQAALDAGLEVAFYRVQPDLAVDERDLMRKLAAAPGAIFLIHYFGFPQPATERIAELCRKAGVWLVEDCAHALYSRLGRTPLGEFGNAAVFSLRKSLPVADGGAAWCANGAPAGPRRTSAGTYRVYAKAAVRRSLPAAWVQAIRARGGVGPAEGPEAFAPEQGLAMTWLSRAIAAAQREDEVVARRRENYAGLLVRVMSQAALAPVFSHLPDGVCPLALPLWVEGRDSLMRWLAGCGVEPYRFGAHPHPLLDVEEFPETARLRGRILALPTHQLLSMVELDRMAALAAEFPGWAAAQAHVAVRS